jgi:phage terminase large subunit
MTINLPPKAQILFQPSRYKGLYGGRGSAKSHSVATYLLLEGMKRPHRILCTREYQNSISESVLKLLENKINHLGLGSFYTVNQSTIVGKNGTEFIFAYGLRRNIESIKSIEGITIVWIEEAQTVSDDSWEVLIPTIREPGSEIICTWNPKDEDDPTHRRLVINPPPDCVTVKMTWRDNPYFPEVLDKERLHCLETDPEAYANIWEGECRKQSQAIIFKGRVTVEAFETGENERFYFGADFGFAQDPATLIRSYVRDRCLHIDHEAWGVGVELDDMHGFYDKVPGSRRWIIRADSSRPETISYLRRKGFRIEAAPKWQGSIEDGIAFLKGFTRIVVHPRCVHTAEEFTSGYRWKVDRLTGEILPIAVDKNNHCIDGIRYALSPLIKQSGTSPLIWELLAS